MSIDDVVADDATGSVLQPRDPIELVVAEVWESVLGIGRPISVLENFFVLGGTSLQLVAIATRLRKRFGKRLPLTVFFTRPTIEQMAVAFRTPERPSFDSALLEIRRAGSGTPLFLTHEIFGGATYAFDLAHYLDPARPVYAFHPPGLYNDREPIDDIRKMTAGYLPELLAVQPDGPYLIGGYCTGGPLALEIAGQLAARGQDVALVVLIDAIPWSAAMIERYTGPLSLEQVRYEEFVTHEEPVSFEAFQAMGEAGQIGYILGGWREVDFHPPALDPAFARRYIDMYLRQARALAAHELARYEGKTVLFLPSETTPSLDPVREAWRGALTDFDIQIVPGNHYSILFRPQVAELGRRMSGLFESVCVP